MSSSVSYAPVKPHLVVKPHQVEDAIAFYKEAFGAETVKTQHVKKQDSQGSVLHAHLKFGDCEFLLVEETAELGSSVHSTGVLHGTSIILHLDCSNVDEAFKRAVGAGAAVSEEVADQPWGQRYGKVIDPFGFVWSFATPHHKHSA